MGEFDVEPKGVEKIPVKDLKELIRKAVAEIKNKPKVEVEYSWSDVMNIMKHELRRHLLIAIGQEKASLGEWLITVIIILGILALSAAVIFPKLGII